MARQQDQKRSRVVRQALREWLERRRRLEFEALLAEGYEALARDAAPLSPEALSLQALAAEGIWRWTAPT